MTRLDSKVDSTNSAHDRDLAFLGGGGQLGCLLRGDTSGLPAFMQSPASWPDSIKTLVAIIFSADQPMYVAWGTEGQMVCNDAYLPILRHKCPSAAAQPLLDLWSGDLELLTRVQADRAAGPAPVKQVQITIARDGRLENAWFSFFHAPVHEAAGAIIGSFCVCSDISSQQLARQSAASTSQRYKNIIDAMSEGVLLMDEDYRVLEINAEALRLSIKEREEVLGKTHWELWPASLGTPVEAVYREAMQQRRPTSLRHHYTSEGLQNWLDLRIYPVPEGGLAAFFRDINGPMQSEAALRASEARFRAAVSAIGFMWTNNAKGEMVGVQAGWSQITGQSPDQYQGLGWTDAVHPDDVQPTLQAWDRSVAGKSFFRHEHRVRVQSGEWRLFSVQAAPVFSDNDQISEWVGVHIDITEAGLAKQALREADHRKDEFLATLAHELRNPLAPIRTAARVLMQPNASAQSVQTCAAILSRQSDHMALLLDDLLDVSRITSGLLELKKTVVNIQAIVDAAVEAARPGITARGHRLTVSLPDKIIEISADSLRLSQVLTNLLNNAVKYTEPQGLITLRVTSSEKVLKLAISDNGIGLAPDNLTRIFVMFSQVRSPIDRSDGGLGIGLSLARGLVELHGGELTAHSEGLGHGTTVTVHLPATLRERSRSDDDAFSKAAQHARPTTPRLSVLVVDDNRDAADTLAMLLEMEGHRAVTAYSGEAALMRAATEAFDVGILDIGMPGMNGYELARFLRATQAGAQLLLIALTGWGQESDQRKALAAGFDRHLSKPVNPDALLQGLTGYVAKKRSRLADNAASDTDYSPSAFSSL